MENTKAETTKTETTLSIVSATIVTRDGTDLIYLTLQGPSPFPNLGYAASARVETQRGYATEWCKQMGIPVKRVAHDWGSTEYKK